MPLMADLIGTSPMILPPADVRWIWHCHCLHSPVSFSDFFTNLPSVPTFTYWPLFSNYCRSGFFLQAGYRRYCDLRFGAVIDRPAILDEENEEYAILRCREIWEARYPSEPFDLETDGGDGIEEGDGGEIATVVSKLRSLVSYFADPYVSETVYLVSAKVRYLEFLHMVRKFGREDARLVPVSDVLLMLLTHKVRFPFNFGFFFVKNK